MLREGVETVAVWKANVAVAVDFVCVVLVSSVGAAAFGGAWVGGARAPAMSLI